MDDVPERRPGPDDRVPPARDAGRPEDRPATPPAPGEPAPNEVDEASMESFPASDPPAWVHTRGD